MASVEELGGIQKYNKEQADAETERVNELSDDEKRAEDTINKLKSLWSNVKGFFANDGRDPLVSYNFIIVVEGIYFLACKGIKGISRENEFDYIQEGGLNDYVHMKRKPVSKPWTFKIERYCGLDLFDPIALGTELMLPILLFVNRDSIELNPSRVYAFTGCTVIGKEYGDLDAEQSSVLLETTTLAYKMMVCLDIPNSWLRKKSWQLSKGSDAENEKRRHYNKNYLNKDYEQEQNNSVYSIEDGKRKAISSNAFSYTFNDGGIKKSSNYDKDPVKTATAIGKVDENKQYLFNMKDGEKTKASEEAGSPNASRVAISLAKKKSKKYKFKMNDNKLKTSKEYKDSPVKKSGVDKMTKSQMEKFGKGNVYPTKLNARKITDILKNSKK